MCTKEKTIECNNETECFMCEKVFFYSNEETSSFDEDDGDGGYNIHIVAICPHCDESGTVRII